MKSASTGSFFSRMRYKFFDWRINREIFVRMFPHLQREKDHGYSFNSHAEMEAQTEELDVQPILDQIEDHIRNMPKGYGRAFRLIVHRDLNERFRMFEKVARRRVQPKSVDPRFVATRA
jgi:hypothetical protein